LTYYETGHVPGNVQCAHFLCNSFKGERLLAIGVGGRLALEGGCLARWRPSPLLALCTETAGRVRNPRSLR